MRVRSSGLWRLVVLSGLCLCVSAPSATASAGDDVNAIAARCPTAAEIAAIDADLQITFSGDPTAGTIVCSAGSRQLTFLQAQAYRSLIIAQRLTFDAPLPWTAESLYNWLIHSIRGIRFRSDIQFSNCCEPANTINIQTGVAIAQPQFAGVTEFVVGFLDLLVHETRHNNIGGHTCGSNDQTLAELGAWGAQYYVALWIAEHSDPSFVTASVRES